jgi:hypothetical protein
MCTKSGRCPAPVRLGRPVQARTLWRPCPGDPRAGWRNGHLPGVLGPVRCEDGERVVRDREEGERKIELINT